MALTESMTITVGGKDIEVPRMKFRQIKIAWTYVMRITAINSQMYPGGIADVGNPRFMELNGERLECMLQVIAAAAQRKDPKITADYLTDVLDYEDLYKVPGWFTQLLDISGFEKADPQMLESQTAAPPAVNVEPSEELKLSNQYWTGTMSSQNSAA